MSKKFIILTTVPISLDFFKYQICELNNFFDVRLISSKSNKLEEIANREGVLYKGINISRNISLIKDVVSLVKLFIYFIFNRPYIIHCNTPKASLLGLIAAKCALVPKRIYYIHGLRYQGTQGFKNKLLVLMEKIACFCATDIIAVSYGVKEIAELELTKKNVCVLHNGSPNGLLINEFLEYKTDCQFTKDSIGIGFNDFVFGFVGRLVGDKGINELVKSFVSLSESNDRLKLVLVGNFEVELDPLEESTFEMIKSHKSIIYVGFQKDVKKYLSIMDVFVSPSYREGFGLSLLEANLMGVPVIATKILGYSEIIEETINGFLISPRDNDELKEKMKWSIDNKSYLRGMKENCRERVVSRYNHVDVLSAALKFYKEI